jgi:hypothetical protein
MNEFQSFPKLHRLRREIIITEKIDGTNAQIFIRDPREGYKEAEIAQFRSAMVEYQGKLYDVFAGSRNRWLVPEQDNFGFAYWVRTHCNELIKLGVGRHFGEWWGRGIQRTYDLQEKRFSLFNTARWWAPYKALQEGHDVKNFPKCCHVVPVLYQGHGIIEWDGHEYVDAPDLHLGLLKRRGSFAAPGFMNPEGIVVYHTAAGQGFKVTFEHDEKGKPE